MEPSLTILDEHKPERKEPNDINPANEEIRAKYFNLYSEYSTRHITYRQLADEYGYSIGHVRKIVKWCAEQMSGTDDTVYREVMIEKMQMHLQRLEKLIENEKGVDKITVLKEIRHATKMLAQAQGLMTDGKTGAPAHIEINLPDLGRGQGVQNAKPIN